MTILNNRNTNYSLTQDSYYSGRMAVLPESMCILSNFGQELDLIAGESSLQTIRKLELLPVGSQALTPLSSSLNDNRLVSPQASNIKVEVQYYGSSIAIAEDLRMNTPENLQSICSKLLSNQSARLIEVLLGKMLKSGLTQYLFTNGTSTNKNEYNITDAINCTKILELNKTPRMTNMNRASTQIATAGSNIGYTSAFSTEGKFQVLNNILSTDILLPAQNANISDYDYSFFARLIKANQSLYNSTEGIIDNPTSRNALIFGEGAFVTVRRSPLSSALIYRSTNHFSFAMHSMISYRTAHGSAICRPEFGISANFSDKTA